MRDDRSPFTLGAACRRQAVLVLTVPAVIVIVVVGAVVGAPVAGTALAVLLGVLALARIVLPVRVVGALAVRSRGLDASVLALLAIGLAVLSVSPNL
ncbi:MULTISPECIES: DUF3017 domain-containing protein [Brachybacterium]|uniref:DUF3017 domain-containing protein n=1 Tax=Brachybacterium alimentarium TaxID=47845 RepID=A0A2A3YM26_9MICO|nr:MULTISPECIES: DUF3017 domain-containing protein [Brachybacterium]PCC35928.1 DUF3017 domain-containing protein [Brachybacterium alimentarium]PCC40340.1 DUF3017 domain-containing protein [Brachybacterium alimentarium]RCS63508.1 DUF3017 domain-containing protein [Brachybacterium sp. JB7]RCS68093.1 DUF3017 domain-containing protein [Brachybacterium alimentarium]RCS79524.1 DUF3017 domain-containing protein [Brachybacterium alimentarium]